jgi:hypothetical protein
MKRRWWLLLIVVIVGVIVWLQVQRRLATQFKQRLWVTLMGYLPAKET